MNKAGLRNGEQPVDERLAMVVDGYTEVLDATKHQDDKIGRLLTAIAFLTAASIAIANLRSGRVLVARFHVAPVTVPLTAIGLAVFLVLVVGAVVLLIASLSTPLRLPGLARGGSGQPTLSQIYFMSIAKFSLDEWKRNWERSSTDLDAERVQMYVKETHNLALRTNLKYERTTEAVAVFSIALFSFGLASIFAAIAATSPKGIVELARSDRLLLGAYVGAFAFVQLLTRARYNASSVDEPFQVRVAGFVTAAPIALGLILIPQGGTSAPWITLAVIVLALVALGCLWLGLKSGWRLVGAGCIVGPVAFAVWGIAAQNYALQLASAASAVVIAALPSLLSPTVDRWKRRADWKARPGSHLPTPF
jgi:hypothetical protein